MDRPRPLTQQHAAMLGPVWASTANPVLSGPLYTPEVTKNKNEITRGVTLHQTIDTLRL